MKLIIELEIDGKVIKLNEAQARTVHRELDRLFGTKDYFYWPPHKPMWTTTEFVLPCDSTADGHFRDTLRITF